MTEYGGGEDAPAEEGGGRGGDEEAPPPSKLRGGMEIAGEEDVVAAEEVELADNFIWEVSNFAAAPEVEDAGAFPSAGAVLDDAVDGVVRPPPEEARSGPTLRSLPMLSMTEGKPSATAPEEGME